MRSAFIPAAFALLAGCGYVGDPKPPALEIPTRVMDLRALQYGDRVLVDFTLPPLTTESLQLTGVRAIDLRVAAGGMERTLSIPPKEPGAFQYDFPSADWSGKEITLTVRATGPKGKTSQWSNAAAVRVGAPLAVPANLKIDNAVKGVRLAWQGEGPAYRIFRASGDARPAPIGDATAAEYVDATAATGTAYRYFVQALDGETRQSEISQVVEITPADEFPPAVPSGLTATTSVNSIELAWDRNTDADLAGYNVYRSTEGGEAERIAGPLDAPAFSDRTIESGKRYRYAVTSVDIVGNESQRSMTAEAVAP